MFIAFDGIDGSGKNTQVNLLQEYLIGEGLKCTALDLGGLSKFNLLIKNINYNRLDISPIVRELVYYFEGLYTNLEVIQKADPNEIILIDRYYLTYYAYGQLNGLSIDDIKYFTKYLIEPDLYFYIDVLPEVTYERVIKYRKIDIPEVGFENYKNCGENKDDIMNKEMFISFQSKVRNNYLQELKNSHHVIDGMREQDTIIKEIINEVQKTWKNRI